MPREPQPNTTPKKFEDIVKQSDLINQVVYDSDTMDELGRVEVLWMFPQINRVLGLVCRSGLLGRQKAAFKLSQIVAVGKGSVLVDGDGEPTVAEKVQKLESLIHREVWSDAGEQVGYITDCLFNYRSGVIVRYLMSKGRFNSFTDDIFFLPPKAIKSFGSQRVLIEQATVETLKPYRHGLKSRLALARETVQVEYIDEWKAELQTLVQQMQSFSQGALRKMERLGDRLRQETRTFVEQAKSSGQTWAEQLRTEGQTLGQTFSESFQEFTTRTEGERSRASADDERNDQVISTAAASMDVDMAWDDEWEDEFDEVAELDSLDDNDWLEDDSDSTPHQSASSRSATHHSAQAAQVTQAPGSPKPPADNASAVAEMNLQNAQVDSGMPADSGDWQAGDDPWDDIWDEEMTPADVEPADVEPDSEPAEIEDEEAEDEKAETSVESSSTEDGMESPHAHEATSAQQSPSSTVSSVESLTPDAEEPGGDRPHDDPWI
ncbi:MAG: hypothetical protein WBA57_22180 [Elainellaceae cyanobacterium]